MQFATFTSIFKHSIEKKRYAVMGGGTFFKVERNECKSKIQKVLWFELANVTSSTLNYDVNNFCQHV